MNKTKSSQFIQQHLANERTYLAWVRTAIAIIGIGFLILNVPVAFLSGHSARADTAARAIGAVAVFMLGSAARSY